MFLCPSFKISCVFQRRRSLLKFTMKLHSGQNPIQLKAMHFKLNFPSLKDDICVNFCARQEDCPVAFSWQLSPDWKRIWVPKSFQRTMGDILMAVVWCYCSSTKQLYTVSNQLWICKIAYFVGAESGDIFTLQGVIWNQSKGGIFYKILC